MVMWHVENILYLEMMSHQNQKVGFVGIPKIGPVLEVAISYYQGKHGVEIIIQRRISLVDQDL